MAFGTASSIFRAATVDIWAGTVSNQGGTGFAWDDTTTVLAALYDDTITAPDNDAASASAAYGGGVWSTSDPPQVADGTNWDIGGEPVTNRTVTAPAADTIRLDADNTPQGGASTTLADVRGCLVYAGSVTTPVADQAYCYNDFGGAQQVTGGNFTIIWDTEGVARWTVTAA
jgi:hypothetical protein